MIPGDPTHLYDLVHEHQVVFELRPTNAIVHHERSQIGFDLELYGTHGASVLEHREPMPPPGCARCQSVWDDLHEIADAVLPPDDRQSTYRIEFYDGAVSFDRKRRTNGFDRPDIQLVIEVRHREGYNLPVDAFETRCVQEMIAALRSLGVQECSWSEWKAKVFRSEHTNASYEGR
jgi:hypothetical protein